ncbi:DUF6328 family protein [Leucobacter sp. UT-8R-CII-1-4]|uniref:DUF6328 family protein n=1 Tax=Leucobacter sp. UT-8R-CII-1-4 TaxID=3040075 RepID=UPI0024A9005E|nr:DUF6328 family protein [Leucobacter sp. UT-8R-CII-1-4]MDI6021931.1 DUF6328 family protein [Leucobacter sp. UT-8R-CII-1-4]
MSASELNDSVELNVLSGETPYLRALRNWNEILQEARVIQACTQIIGGFLLAVAFQQRFHDLDAYQLDLYLVLVSCAGIATALGIGLVVMHRMHFGSHQKIRIVRTGNRLLICNLFVVSLLGLLVTSFIFDVVVGRVAGFIALAAGLLLTTLLWGIVSRNGSAERARDYSAVG